MTAITDNLDHLRDLADSVLPSSGDGRLLRWAVDEIEALRHRAALSSGRHTRTSCKPPDAGPDYCAECSELAQEWVEWPCGNGRSTDG